MAKHYRDIEVGGETYKYVVGKDATKVVGVGVFENSIIGQYEKQDALGKVAITPAVVKAAIIRKLAGELIA